MFVSLNRFIIVLIGSLSVGVALAQGMLDQVDMSSPAMTEADISRAELIALLDAATPGKRLDLTNRRLSGLDLSGVDFKGADLRWARLNGTDLRGAKMAGVDLSLAWLVRTNLEDADLSGAKLFSTQAQRANLKNANLDNARIVANFQNADLSGASIRNANLAADMKNQSMGLMGTVMISATVDEVDFRGSDLSHLNAEFATFHGAMLDGVDLSHAKLGGADLSGASVAGLDLTETDVDSARLVKLKGEDKIVGLDSAKNVNKAFRK